MPFKIIVTRDFDHMSSVAAEIVAQNIAEKQAAGGEHVLGLATGNSPTGLYKDLAALFNNGTLDASRVRSFNLDEYVGLPGENPQQRALHRESYTYFMVQEFFGLLDTKFAETYVPWGTLIDQDDLIIALEEDTGSYELMGVHTGKAVAINGSAEGMLAWVKREILDAYEAKIVDAGGIDLQIVGVGGHGHVAFHENGIPFEGNGMLLVRLDDNTVENAVADGHFASMEDSPHYAISMGTELVYRAKTVVLVASGPRKTGPMAASVLGDVTCDVPISYGQEYVAGGGDLVYVLDEAAGAELLERRAEVEVRGFELLDLR